MVSGLIVEVVATMIIWNNISPASPYFDDVRSGISEGPVIVWSVQSVVLQILAFGVCLPDEAVGWFSMRQSRSLFLSIYNKVRYFQHIVPMVND